MLEVDNITVRFTNASEPVIDRLDLSVGANETVALLGPSGCGKTTLLRSVAGLQTVETGSIVLDGKDVTEVPTHRRGLGLMFQDHALFPHLSVSGNVEFGLRTQRVDPKERRDRVNEVLELVGLAPLSERPVDTLSGGERQRVALARAIAPSPGLLMLDEPLGSLDRALRDRLILELQTIFDHLKMSVLYVTHDQTEAMALADRMVIMNRGRTVQKGTPAEIWRKPHDRFVADFLGLTNIFTANVKDGIATTPWGLQTNLSGPDGTTEVLVRPDAVSLDPSAGSTCSGGIPATVTGCMFAGYHTKLKLRIRDDLNNVGHGAQRAPVEAEAASTDARLELEAVLRNSDSMPAIGANVRVWVHPDGVNRLSG